MALSELYRPPLALLTDLYQLTRAYGYWKLGRAEQEAVFHLFFRKPPFAGGYAIAAGLRPGYSGCHDDEWHVRRAFPQRVLGEVIFFAEVIAVIGPEDDDRIVAMLTVVECFQQLAHERISMSDAA